MKVNYIRWNASINRSIFWSFPCSKNPGLLNWLQSLDRAYGIPAFVSVKRQKDDSSFLRRVRHHLRFLLLPHSGRGWGHTHALVRRVTYVFSTDPSKVAEGEGFEPPVPFRVQTISRQLTLCSSGCLIQFDLWNWNDGWHSLISISIYNFVYNLFPAHRKRWQGGRHGNRHHAFDVMNLVPQNPLVQMPVMLFRGHDGWVSEHFADFVDRHSPAEHEPSEGMP